MATPNAVPQTTTLPPPNTARGGRGKPGLGTALAAVAVVIALISLAYTTSLHSGATGPAGPVGPPAPAGTDWAVVNSTGNLSRGSGVVSASEVDTGIYSVVFSQEVSSCGYIATVGSTGLGGSQLATLVTVGASSGNPDALTVWTYNQTAGTSIDASFHLVVLCSSGPWAVVSWDGQLIRGNGAVATYQYEPGGLSVLFNRNVSNCAYLGTILQNGSASAAPGQIDLTGRSGNPAAIWVSTYTASGAYASEEFTVAAACSTTGWAVVDSSGSLARGNANSTALLYSGRYQVVFETDIVSCAYVATAGSTGSSGVYPAASVTLATRSGNVYGVWVETFDGTGIRSDQSFHLAVYC